MYWAFSLLLLVPFLLPAGIIKVSASVPDASFNETLFRRTLMEEVEKKLNNVTATMEEKDRSPFDVNGIKLYVFQSVEFLYKLVRGDLEIQLVATKNEIEKVVAKIKLIDDNLEKLMLERLSPAVAYTEEAANYWRVAHVNKEGINLRLQEELTSISPDDYVCLCKGECSCGAELRKMNAIKESFLAVLKAKFERVHLYLNQRIPRLERIQRGLDHMRLITTSEYWQQYVNPAFMYSYSLQLFGGIIRTLVDTMPCITIAYFALYVLLTEGMIFTCVFYSCFLFIGLFKQGNNYKMITSIRCFDGLSIFDLFLGPDTEDNVAPSGWFQKSTYSYIKYCIWALDTIIMSLWTIALMYFCSYSRHVRFGIFSVFLAVIKLSNLFFYDTPYILMNLAVTILFAGSTRFASYFHYVIIAAAVIQVAMMTGRFNVSVLLLGVYLELYSYFVKQDGFNLFWISACILGRYGLFLLDVA